LAYLYNRDIETAALIANHSAAVAVAKKGTASVTIEEIRDSFNASNKIIPFAEIAQLSKPFISRGKRLYLQWLF
jgi:bifunctional ADP-heptose synthase (sugar kinase/adenylyltransferase)